MLSNIKTDATVYTVINGECNQVEANQQYEKIFEELDFKVGTCTSMGFDHEDGTKTMDVPIIGEVTVSLYSMPKPGDATDDTIYRLVDGECAEATLNAKVATELEKFAKFAEGTCSSQGYTKEDGTKTMSLPIVGDVTVSVYSKASLKGSDTLYRIIEGKECSEATIASQYDQYLEKFAHFAVGTCSSQGYTHEDGTKTVDIPVVGDVTLSLYSKPAFKDNATLFRIADGECGEATLLSQYEKYVEEFAHFAEGTCSG